MQSTSRYLPTFESSNHQPPYLAKPDSHRRVHIPYYSAHITTGTLRSLPAAIRKRAAKTEGRSHFSGRAGTRDPLLMLGTNPLPSTALLQKWVRTWSELPVPSLFRPCGPLVRVQQNGHQSPPPKGPKTPLMPTPQWNPYLPYTVPSTLYDPSTITAPKA